MDKSKFKYKTQVRVRNYEVDWQGIVHNGNYLLYFEIGRVEYLKNLGAKIDLGTIRGESKVVLVRNEIDYKAPAYFDQLLNVYTRVSFIKNSSFAMEGILERVDDQKIIALNTAIHVWLDPATDSPKTVGSDFRHLVKGFEGNNCTMLSLPATV